MEIKTKFNIDQKVYAVNPPVHYDSAHQVRTKADNREWEIRGIIISEHGNSDIDGVEYDIEYRCYDGEVVAIFQEGELVTTLEEWWESRLEVARARVKKIKGIIEDLKKDI